jgi:hypothetical protein
MRQSRFTGAEIIRIIAESELPTACIVGMAQSTATLSRRLPLG